MLICFILYVIEKMLVYAPYIKEDISNIKGVKKKYNLFVNLKVNQPVQTYVYIATVLFV